MSTKAITREIPAPAFPIEMAGANVFLIGRIPMHHGWQEFEAEVLALGGRATRSASAETDLVVLGTVDIDDEITAPMPKDAVNAVAMEWTEFMHALGKVEITEIKFIKFDRQERESSRFYE